VHSFVDTASIDGVLPGGASLDPTKFVSLIKNAIGS
jgi:triosephosphate isomerase